MNIQSLPTDNMYKFIALFGLVIFIASIVFPLPKSQDIELMNIEIEKGWKLLDCAKASSDFKYTQQLQDIKQMDGLRVKNEKAPSKDTEQLWLKQAKCSLNELRISVDETEKSLKDSIELIAGRKKLIVLLKQLLIYKKLCYIGGILGPILMLIGFILWYYKVQKYEDIILRKKAKEGK